MKKLVVLDHAKIVKAFRDQGKVSIKEGNGKIVTFLKPELWSTAMGNDWVYLLFDLFQIRSICKPFSEVSLDIVEYSNKPTIYHSPANSILKHGPIEKDVLKFSLILEPDWNKLLFQFSNPVIVKLSSIESPAFETPKFFPLYNPSFKEMYLGPEGEVKIIKG